MKPRLHDRQAAGDAVAPESRDLLASSLEWLGLGARPGLADRLARLAVELAIWGPQLGLSSIRDANLSLLRHVLDSLLLLRVLEQPRLLVDVGSGAGLPALPLALAWPQTQVVAVDSRRKSGWLVLRLARGLSAGNVTHLCTRADAAAARPQLRHQADLVCARGLANAERAVTLCAPFATEAGDIAILGGPDLDHLPLREGWRIEVVSLPKTDWRRRILIVSGRPGPQVQ